MSLKIFKKIMLFVSVILIAFSLFACGGKAGSAETTANEKTETTPDFDGNVVNDVHIENGTFKKTLSEEFNKDNTNKKVQKNIDTVKTVLDSANLETDSKIFECLYGDMESDISVWSLTKNRNGETLNNYGIIIRSNGKNFPFADVCHGNNPSVDVDEDAGKIMLAGGVVEGTGTHIDGLYIFEAKDDNVEKIGFVDPFNVQNYFADNIKYEVNINDIKFKLGNKVISEITNTEDGQGSIRSLAVGDQIIYEIDDDHNIVVNITPGIEFVTTRTLEEVEKDMSLGSDGEKLVMNNPAGSSVGTTAVLFYDNMPTFSIDVKIDGANATFNNIHVAE